MRFVCIAAFADYSPGDVIEVPAGSSLSPSYFAPVAPDSPLPAPVADPSTPNGDSA